MFTGSWLGKCPQCENPAIYDCGRNGNRVICPKCGYTFSLEVLEIYPAPRMIRQMEKRGTGVLWLERKDCASGSFDCLSKGATPLIIDRFNQELQRTVTDTENSYLTRWDEDAKSVIVVAGHVYNPFGDEIEDVHLDANEFPCPFSLRMSDDQIG